MIIFHMVGVIKGVDVGSGLRSRIRRGGGSVASARAARVSWKRFTHMSCTGVRTDSCDELATAETNARPTEVKVMVIWNWKKNISLTGCLYSLLIEPLIYLQKFLDGIADCSSPHDSLDN